MGIFYLGALIGFVVGCAVGALALYFVFSRIGT